MSGSVSDQVNLVKMARLAPKTRQSYERSLKRFSKWLCENGYEDVVVDETIQRSLLTVEIVQHFLVTQLERGVGFQGLASYRSALNYLFEEEGSSLPDEFIAEISSFYAGLKRVDAGKRRAGETLAPIKEGKDAMEYVLYRTLAKTMLQSAVDPLLWAHCYMVLSWNLMCRCNNTAHIRVDQIGWNGDCLHVYFATTKTDQGGDRSKDPFHIYANPLAPEICPILALGMYFLYFGTGKTGSLFTGNCQE